MTTPAKTIQLSSLYYPNKMARILIQAIEDVMGKNGLNALLHLSGLEKFIDNYPPENLERQFDFAYIAALTQGLEEMYGPRGGRGLALRAGRACFAQGLRNFGALAGAGDLAFKVLPLQAKLKMGLPAMASIFSNFSDQNSAVKEYEDHFLYVIFRSSECTNRKTDKPVCNVAVGILQEGLKWVSGGLEFRVVEVKCQAKGDPECEFVIYKQPLNV